MTILKEINLAHALIVSTVIHFFSIIILNGNLPDIFSDIIKDQPETIEIEFEFFQAEAQREKHIFIPQGIPQINHQSDNQLDSIKSKGDVAIVPESLLKDLGFDFETEVIEEDELLPSFTEQEEIKQATQKTSDSLQSEIDLEEIEKNSQIKWDYGNRIRTLIENIASLPAHFNNIYLNDVVMVKISLNRKGELIHGTPLILKEDQSKYPEINEEAIKAVKKSSLHFPELPSNYAKDEITLWLPIKFISNND